MPSTAPDLTGTATTLSASFRYIDHTGDKTSDNQPRFKAAVTAAEIEALKDALGAASQANLYEVDRGSNFKDVPDKTDADAGDRSEVSNNITILAKNAVGDARSLTIPAPVPEIFVDPDSDEINPGSTELAAVMTAWLATLDAGFDIISARYTGKKQWNSAVYF